MQAVNYSHARNNLKSLIEDVCDNDEEFIITTKNNKSAVLISLDEFNVRYKEIKKSVDISLQQIENGEVMSIEEAFERVKSSYRD